MRHHSTGISNDGLVSMSSAVIWYCFIHPSLQLEAGFEIVEVYCLGKILQFLQQPADVNTPLTVSDAYLYAMVRLMCSSACS